MLNGNSHMTAWMLFDPNQTTKQPMTADCAFTFQMDLLSLSWRAVGGNMWSLGTKNGWFHRELSRHVPLTLARLIFKLRFCQGKLSDSEKISPRLQMFLPYQTGGKGSILAKSIWSIIREISEAVDREDCEVLSSSISDYRCTRI